MLSNAFRGTLTTHASSESNAYGANRIVGSGCDLSGAPGAVSITIDQIVPRHRILVMAVDVVARLWVLKRKSATASIEIRDRLVLLRARDASPSLAMEANRRERRICLDETNDNETRTGPEQR